MTSSAPIEETCRHGHRGTAVCLYCRQEHRDAARRRRKRVLTRFGLTTLGGAVVIALIVGVLVTISPASRTSPVAEADTAGEAPRPAPPPGSPQPARPSLLSPQIAPGSKELGEGMIAERVGDEVTVSFDTDSLRTRFDWKFEGIVRATLPLVFGEPARAALDSIQIGTLLEGASLMRELPRRGFLVPLDSGLGRIRVWPITRDGRDGPIVAAYRAVITK